MNDERLESWKEIAAYLRRDVRTVQRWEKYEGLPVHRHLHRRVASVYALVAELDTWMASRHNQPAPDDPPKRSWIPVAIGVVAVALAAVLVILSPGLLATKVLPGLSVRRVWIGPDLDRLGPVTPDGRHLLFMDKTSETLAVLDLTTGKHRPLMQAPPGGGESLSQAVSADGRWVAYNWTRGFNQELRTIGMNGQDDRLVFRNPNISAISVEGWSPDGKFILASCQRTNDGVFERVLIAAQDGTLRVLKTLDARFRPKTEMSPDGRWVAYDVQDVRSLESDIFVQPATNSDDAGEAALVRHPGFDSLLGWTPDGKSVLFASDRSGTMDAWLLRVRDGRPAGGPERVRRDMGYVWPIGFTRQGSFYYGVRTGASDTFVAPLDLQTGNVSSVPVQHVRRFVGESAHSDWSPDGRALAHTSDFPGARVTPPARIGIRTEGEDKEREISPQPALFHVSSIHWSPDGSGLLVTGPDHERRWGIFQVDVQTSRTTQLLRSDEIGVNYPEAVYSPNGRTIYYKRRMVGVEPAPLIAWDLKTATHREIHPRAYRFSLSPNGREMAYCTFESGREFIAVIPLDGGPPREIYTQPRSRRIVALAWTPDGRYVMFARGGELWRAPSQGGGAAKKMDLSAENLREIRVHPGGGKIAFTAGEIAGEVWVMENLNTATR
jgi:Tol biopolymer transport system component